MKGRILAVTAVVTLALTGIASAAANGSYSGSSRITISGTTVTHPFTLKVKNGKVIKVAFIAGATCASLEASTGVSTHFKIVHNKFRGSWSNPVFRIAFTGSFKSGGVSGSFTGTAHTSATTCSVPKNTFQATHT